MKNIILPLLAIALGSSAASAEQVVSDGTQWLSKSGVVDLPNQVGLVSHETMLAFSRRNGDITQIVHRPSGQDFACSQREPLFSIFFAQPSNEKVSVGPRSFKRVQVEKTDDRTLALIFDRHPKLKLSARVTARVDDAAGIRLRLTVHNETDLAIKSILFPRASWRPVLGEDASDDRLLVPWRDSGELIVSPGTRTAWQESDYPGMVCAQFAAYYDGRAGVYLATEDAGGFPKNWIMNCRANRKLELNVTHLFEETPGTDVALTYDVVLRTFEGDWRDAAALYKSWAVHQPWCAQKLADRKDVPQFLKEGAGIIIQGGFQNDEAILQHFGKDLEKLPDLVSAYRRKTGLAHVVLVPYGWENRGTWAGIHYYPAHPSNEAWIKVSKQLHKNGDRLMFMTSGFWWVVKRQAYNKNPAFDDSDRIENYKPMLVKKPDGRPWTMDCYDLTKKPKQPWRGLSMHLCHGSERAQQTMKEIFLQAARLGCAIVSFDQEQGGRQFAPCYDTKHGHGPGYGQYIWTGLRKTCEAILTEGRAVNPELSLCMENTSELAIPYMATYWSRQFRGGFREAPRLPSGVSQSVGLFSYLYHEYTTAIGAACVQGQGEKGRRPSAAVRCFILSNNLCRGLIPGPFVHDVPLNAADDWHKTVSQAFFSYCQPYARFPEYLVLGETVPPPNIKCHEAEGWVPIASARAKPQPSKAITPRAQRATIKFSSVNVGSFKATDGSIGTVLANTTDDEQSATLALPWAAARLVLYDSARKELRQWRDVSAGQEIRVTIEPFGTRMLVAN